MIDSDSKTEDLKMRSIISIERLVSGISSCLHFHYFLSVLCLGGWGLSARRFEMILGNAREDLQSLKGLFGALRVPVILS